MYFSFCPPIHSNGDPLAFRGQRPEDPEYISKANTYVIRQRILYNPFRRDYVLHYALFSHIVITKKLIDRNTEIIGNSRNHLHVGITSARLSARYSLRGNAEGFCEVVLCAPVTSAQFSNYCSYIQLHKIASL